MNHSDLDPYLHELYAACKSDKSIAKEIDFVQHFRDNWMGDFLHPYGDILFDAGLIDNSLFFAYLAAQTINFEWYRHSMMHGAYTIVFRELRCILEGLFIVYKIESLHYGASMEAKLNILETAENNRTYYGKGVFSTSTYPDWQTYYTVYKHLSSYIHFSYSKVAHHIREIADLQTEAINYSYDRQQFLDAHAVWRQIAALCLDMAAQLGKLDNCKVDFSFSIFE